MKQTIEQCMYSEYNLIRKKIETIALQAYDKPLERSQYQYHELTYIYPRTNRTESVMNEAVANHLKITTYKISRNKNDK